MPDNNSVTLDVSDYATSSGALAKSSAFAASTLAQFKNLTDEQQQSFVKMLADIALFEGFSALITTDPNRSGWNSAESAEQRVSEQQLEPVGEHKLNQPRALHPATPAVGRCQDNLARLRPLQWARSVF